MLLEVKLAEDDGDALLQLDAVDQYQYFYTFRAGAADEPEGRLMRAVLEDALRCLKNVPIRSALQISESVDSRGAKEA